MDLKASQIIIPYGGFYNGTESLFVLNLGSLKIHSVEKAKGDTAQLTVKQLVRQGKSEEEILKHLRMYSYDKFVLKIVNFQVCFLFKSFKCFKYLIILNFSVLIKSFLKALVTMPNEDWQTALSDAVSPMKILQPTTLEVQFHKCLITDDPLLPKIRLIGQLPSLEFNISGN